MALFPRGSFGFVLGALLAIAVLAFLMCIVIVTGAQI